MSPMQWSRVFGPPFWGWLVDSRDNPFFARKLIINSAFLAILSSLLLFLNWSLPFLFFVFCLISFFLSGHIPITESLAMQQCEGNLGVYGRMRLWGSVGFVVSVLVGGFIFDFFGIKYLPHTLCLLLSLLVVVPIFLPQKKTNNKDKTSESLKNKLFDRRSITFLFASFFMLVAHAPLYTLYSLWLENNGFSKIEIGYIWSLGVLAEILFFYFQNKIFNTINVKRVWVLCFFIAAVRFLMIMLSNGNLFVIVLAQLLHAFTFGAHHSASMSLINKWFPANAQTRGQSLYTMASYGFGGSMGGIATGWVWENFSPEASFMLAVFAALIGGFFALKAIKL